MILLAAAGLAVGSLLLFASVYYALTVYPNNGTIPAQKETAVSWRERRQIARLRARQKREERKRLKKIKRIAHVVRGEIISSLARQGYTYIYERKGATARASKPRIRHVLYGADSIWYRIDRLPFKVVSTDLTTPETEVNLSLDIGRECHIVAKTDIGLWIIVGLKSGLYGVPKYFAWYDESTEQNARELLPKTKPWAIALGMTENRKFVYTDIRKFPHLLVAGATGGGKSVFMNQLLCSMITRLSPDQLEIVLIDLKGGLEFWPFKEIPHIRRQVVTEPEEVPAALQDIVNEKKRRFDLLRNAGHKDITGWNSTQPYKLPYIFVFFDEIANLMLTSKLRGKVEALVQDLAAQGRALGLHLILCTQVPTKDVLSTIIRGNITARVVFNTDVTGSLIALGNGRAATIPPGGRAIYKMSSEQTEIQAPFISESQVKEVIDSLANTDPARPQITPEDLFIESLTNLNGNFSYRAIYSAFDGAISQQAIKDIAKAWQYDKETDSPIIELNELGRYALVPINGHGKRQLVLAGEVEKYISS